MDYAVDASNTDTKNGNFGPEVAQPASLAQEAAEPALQHIEAPRQAPGELCNLVKVARSKIHS